MRGAGGMAAVDSGGLPVTFGPMPKGAKRMPPNAGGQGIGAAVRLIAREPHLASAARLEERLGSLYLRLADSRAGQPDAPRWHEAAQLSGRIAEVLADLARAAGRPRPNPRPTRIRVATLREADLADTAACVEALADTPEPAPEALADLVAREGRTVLRPLVRICGVAPCSSLFGVWQMASDRRRVLRGLGLERNGVDWPDPPRGAGRGGSGGEVARSGPRPGRGSRSPAGAPWTASGRVERINRTRHSGTARTEDGRTAFFPARAVAGGLGALRPGDPVRLLLRRGPLGLTALRVEACADAQDDPGPGPA